MLSARRRLLLFSAALFAINVAIAWRMFHVEYLSQTGTVVGVIIAYARYIRDYWPDVDWCRMWYAGLPFRNAYVPGVPVTTAAIAAIGHLSPGRAFYLLVSTLYALGPVTLFWMAYRLSRAMSWSLCVGLAYSLTSPSAWLAGEIHKDLGSLFWDQRLHTMVGYADNPHVASLTLLPLAILALDVALEKRKPVYMVLAAIALAAVPLTNWPGAIALAFAVVAYGLSPGKAGAARRWITLAGIGILGYCMAIRWIPPSTVIATQADTQGFLPANRFGARHLVYAAVLIAGAWLLLWLTKRVPGYQRFFLLFFFFMAAITLGWYWLGLTLIAQPNRFHLAMEMGFTLSAVFCARAIAARWPALRKPALLTFAVLCICQFVAYRSYARRLIQGIDITRTSEYKTAAWFRQHMPDSRVMVPGSSSFWINVFTDTPQLAGCCPQGVLNETAPVAEYGIRTDLTAESRAFENTLLWFKALGIRAVAVSGPRSTEVYKPFYHPHKFDGRLPELWRDGDDVIFGVPWRYYSIAHAMPAAALTARAPLHGVDSAPLVPYVAAMERPDAPHLEVQWIDNETMRITGNVPAGEIVSVQENEHAGWHATANGAARRVFADKLGLMVVDPQCNGPCTIQLHFDGGREMRAARWISGLAWLGAVVWIAAPAFRKLRFRSA